MFGSVIWNVHDRFQKNYAPKKSVNNLDSSSSNRNIFVCPRRLRSVPVAIHIFKCWASIQISNLSLGDLVFRAIWRKVPWREECPRAQRPTLLQTNPPFIVNARRAQCMGKSNYALKWQLVNLKNSTPPYTLFRVDINNQRIDLNIQNKIWHCISIWITPVKSAGHRETGRPTRTPSLPPRNHVPITVPRYQMDKLSRKNTNRTIEMEDEEVLPWHRSGYRTGQLGDGQFHAFWICGVEFWRLSTWPGSSLVEGNWWMKVDLHLLTWRHAISLRLQTTCQIENFPPPTITIDIYSQNSL